MRGELRLVDSPDSSAGVAVVTLAGQDLCQEGFMGQAFSCGGLGDGRGLVADGGQRQETARGQDRGLGGGSDNAVTARVAAGAAALWGLMGLMRSPR